MIRGALVLAVVAAWPAAAGAEEGLFVARLAGGVSTVGTEAPATGGSLSGSMDLGVTQRVGVIVGADAVWHDAQDTLGLALGFKLLPYEAQWTRIYLVGAPALLVTWPGAGGDAEWDLALRAAVGLEYLWMWGLGFVVEAGATAPVAFDQAAVSLGAGLFMEF